MEEIEINKELIGVNIINIRDKSFKTPLHYAITNKNNYALNKLLENDGNPNYVDNKGYNLLHHTVFTRDSNICKTVIAYIANINMVTLTGDTALHYACNLQLTDIAKMLINAKINVNIQDYQHEFTPLHYAVNLNITEILEELLKDVSTIQMIITETFDKSKKTFNYEIKLAENKLFENITNLYKFSYYVHLTENNKKINASLSSEKNNADDDMNPLNKIIIMIMLNYFENEHPSYYKKVVLKEQLEPLITEISHRSFELNII